jgi:predicted O-linked N-acetylglucosamine transferase (SPINDLY family)
MLRKLRRLFKPEVAVRNTTSADELLKLAGELQEHGRRDAAAETLRRNLEAHPDHWESLNALAAIKLQNNELEEALVLYGAVIGRKPNLAEPYYKRGNASNRLGRLENALADYDRALGLDPAHARALCNRGAVLERLGRREEALDSYDRAVAINPLDFLTHYNRGSVLKELKRFDDALASYDRAVELKPDFAAAYNNRGNVLAELQRHEAAIASFDRSIALEPVHAQAFHGRGLALHALNRFDQAIVEYRKAIEISPTDAEAHHGLGHSLASLKQFEAAILSFDRALALGAGTNFLLGTCRATKMQMCQWDGFSSDLDKISQGVDAGKPVCNPLALAALLDSPSLMRSAAECWIREESPFNAALGGIPVRPPSAKIRIGYFSSDFCAHPVAFLAAGLFERHDRSKFEVTAFAFGPEANDAMQGRLTKAFDRFVDARRHSDVEVAALAREIGIDIAVDLNGITLHCRPKIFALRAAPIQVNYLGYPGTMGAEFMDYLVGDRTVIPRVHQAHYAEKIIYLPDCFIPFDSEYAIADKLFTREELGLPRQGFVFCCFNNALKITPAMFDSWMRILMRTEASVLWLSRANSVAVGNLRKEADRRGVDPERLIFAERLASLPEHLARLRRADLFLDTLPYNAHSTALDALWAGVPVLTCEGQGFAARVAASFLRTLGLPQLITGSIAQYEGMAVDLAADPGRLASLRQHLAHNRSAAALFDTERYTRNLEAAYQKIYARYHSGGAPEHVDQPAATQEL